jgi:Protein of unknown function (DUF3134)
LINNPSLRWRPRSENAPIIHKQTENTILNWLEGTGRLIDREVVVDPALLSPDDELSAALLGTDDMEYEDDDFVSNDEED